jgi:hypothetical protein
MRLEKAINPLLDDNDLVAFSYILATIVEDRLRTVPNVRLTLLRSMYASRLMSKYSFMKISYLNKRSW